MTKAMTMVRASRGVSAVNKRIRLLYRTCMVPVAMYGLCLWYLKGAHIKRIIKQFITIQCLVVLWITGCFKTSPLGEWNHW